MYIIINLNINKDMITNTRKNKQQKIIKYSSFILIETDFKFSVESQFDSSSSPVKRMAPVRNLYLAGIHHSKMIYNCHTLSSSIPYRRLLGYCWHIIAFRCHHHFFRVRP